jgi:phosphoglycolate phosphatase-like HAD superfamily hydrolase
VEELLARAAGHAVPRARIAEVGNLAAAAPGMGRALIPAMARQLHQLGYRWVVFTATRELRNALRRLQLEPLVLAPARAERLPDRGASWGSYYAHDPAVVGGRIRSCLGTR